MEFLSFIDGDAIVKFLVFGMIEMVLFYMCSIIHFKLHFENGVPKVAVHSKRFWLPFTEKIVEYNELKKVNIVEVVVGTIRLFALSSHYNLELIFPKQKITLFYIIWFKDTALEYKKKIDVAIRDCKDCEVSHGVFTIWQIIFFIAVVVAIEYILSNKSTTSDIFKNLFISGLPIPILCSVLSIIINFYKRIKKSDNIILKEFQKDSDIKKDADSNAKFDRINDSIIK